MSATDRGRGGVEEENPCDDISKLSGNTKSVLHRQIPQGEKVHMSFVRWQLDLKSPLALCNPTKDPGPVRRLPR